MNCCSAGCYHWNVHHCDYYGVDAKDNTQVYRFMNNYDDARRCRGYDGPYANGGGGGGSSSSSGGCFLTSACVEHMGKADDCEELTTLRAFRDGWMKDSDEGKALIAQYYEIAPGIVQKIENSKDKGCHYCYIYSVVQKCVDLIKQGKNKETMDEYKTMVLTLQKQFA